MATEPPDGYEWTGKGMEIRLIDPATCPRGHPYAWGQRSYSPCSEHGGHPAWWCLCGLKFWRWQGQFTDTLPCR